MMASVSQITRPSTASAGTLPVGEWRWMSTAVVDWSSGITCSSNGRPKCVITSQGRIDQDE